MRETRRGKDFKVKLKADPEDKTVSTRKLTPQKAEAVDEAVDKLTELFIGGSKKWPVAAMEAAWEKIEKVMTADEQNEVLAETLFRMAILADNHEGLNWVIDKYQGDRTRMVAENFALMNRGQDGRGVLAPDGFVAGVIENIQDQRMEKGVLKELEQDIREGRAETVRAYFFKRDLQQILPEAGKRMNNKPHL